MREIVTIQLGQCGNQIGKKVRVTVFLKWISLEILSCLYFKSIIFLSYFQFWETICEEHDLNYNGELLDREKDNGKLGVYFHEIGDGQKERHIPRTVLVDLEPGALDSIRGGLTSPLYKPGNFVVGIICIYIFWSLSEL